MNTTNTKEPTLYVKICKKLQVVVFIIPFLLFFSSCAPSPSTNYTQAILALALQQSPANLNTMCPGETSLPTGASLADTVTSAPAHTGVNFKDSSKATNGICGGGRDTGGIDVFSMDSTGAGSTLILEWAGKKITNNTGFDFVVFENTFNISGNASTRFMDLIVAEVSIDNISYCGFAPDYTNAIETSYSNNPVYWSNFAGKTPVLLNQSSNPLDATEIFNQTSAGGDGFDLSNLSDLNLFSNGCNTTLRNNIQSNGFIYLRLRSASNLINPDTASSFVSESISNGPDIDGVVARYAQAR